MHITDNEDIWKGLFPGCGPTPSTAKGGGKTKVEFYGMLAGLIFATHEKYAGTYALFTTSPAEKADWANKIKNRLNRCVGFPGRGGFVVEANLILILI